MSSISGRDLHADGDVQHHWGLAQAFLFRPAPVTSTGRALPVFKLAKADGHGGRAAAAGDARLGSHGCPLGERGKNAMLRRYWVEFELPQAQARLVSYGLGCGVTAYSYDDAVSLMQELVFKAREMPPVRTVIEDVDIATLDPKHVRINMGVPIYRGVWFPLSPPPTG